MTKQFQKRLIIRLYPVLNATTGLVNIYVIMLVLDMEN